MKRFPMRVRTLSVLAILTIAATSVYARGQREANRRHNPLDGAVTSGVIASMSANGFSVAEENGATVTVELARRARFAVGERTTFDAIARGDLVDVIASRGSGDNLSATTVFLLPGAFARAGRGGMTTHSDGQTNAYGKVTALSTDSRGRMLTVDYNGGSMTFAVGESVKIEKVSLSSSNPPAVGSRVSVFGRRDGASVKGALIVVVGP